MKIIARITICMAFVFSLASFAPAQRKKPAVNLRVMNDIFRQLFLDCKAAAPSPESWDDIKIDRPVTDYIDIRGCSSISRKNNVFDIWQTGPFLWGSRGDVLDI